MGTLLICYYRIKDHFELCAVAMPTRYVRGRIRNYGYTPPPTYQVDDVITDSVPHDQLKSLWAGNIMHVHW